MKDDDYLCHCGTKKEAAEAAFKLFKQMLEHDCSIWSLQVLTALHQYRSYLVQGMLNTHKSHKENLEFILQMEIQMKPAVDTTNQAALLEILKTYHEDSVCSDRGLGDEIKKMEAKLNG